MRRGPAGTALQRRGGERGGRGPAAPCAPCWPAWTSPMPSSATMPVCAGTGARQCLDAGAVAAGAARPFPRPAPWRARLSRKDVPGHDTVQALREDRSGVGVVASPSRWTARPRALAARTGGWSWCLPRDRVLRQSQGKGEALLGEDVVERGSATAISRALHRAAGPVPAHAVRGRSLGDLPHDRGRSRHRRGAGRHCRRARSAPAPAFAGIARRLGVAPDVGEPGAGGTGAIGAVRVLRGRGRRRWAEASGRTGFRRRASRAFEAAQAALGQWPIARRMPRFLPSGQFSTRARPCPTRIASQ